MFDKAIEFFFGNGKSLLPKGKYTINDPSTPELTTPISIPSANALKYAVKDMSATPSNPNQLRSLNCHITIGNYINNIQMIAPVPLKKWATTPVLQVFPSAGRDLNAYYNRSSLRFFFYDFNGKRFFFSESSDIVAHELGHAILDAMRPDFWSVQALEIWSFHEAFSDIVAMHNLMSYDLALEKAISETNQTFRGSNSISRLAEEVGILIRNVTNNPTCLPNALRDPAEEKFLYVEPSKLNPDAPNNMLAAECHSFGRVFSAAWYEIFVRLFDHHKSLGLSSLASAKKARDESFLILLRAIPSTPRNVNYYACVARSMVVVSKSFSKAHETIISAVFDQWNILKKDQIKMLSSLKMKDFPSEMVQKVGKSHVVCLNESKTVKISDLSVVSSMAQNEDLDVEIAMDSYYEFDSKGRLVNEFVPNLSAAKEAAELCLLGMGTNFGPEKMWHTDNGKLTRMFIS